MAGALPKQAAKRKVKKAPRLQDKIEQQAVMRGIDWYWWGYWWFKVPTQPWNSTVENLCNSLWAQLGFLPRRQVYLFAATGQKHISKCTG